MTNRHVVVGLTWDGYDIQRQDFGVLLDIDEGLDELPELRTHSDIVPFRDGQRPSPAKANRRPIVLGGIVDGLEATGRADYRAYIDGLKASFSPFRSTPGTLVATLEDGSTRWIRAMPLDMLPVRIVPGMSRTTVELVAHDPFWYSAYGIATMDSGLFMDDGHFMDSGGEVVVTPTSSSHSISFDTFGTADVKRVRVRMTGPSLAGAGIEVDTPDGIVGFVMGTALGAGEELVVDNYARTVTVNGVTARADMTLKAANRHGEYVRFRAGLNTVRILGAPAEARIHLLSTWS